MSGAAQILVKCQELAQLVARRHVLAGGRLVGYLLALPKGGGAVSGVGDSFSHFEDLAARRDLDVSSMNFLEILEFCRQRPLSRLPDSAARVGRRRIDDPQKQPIYLNSVLVELLLSLNQAPPKKDIVIVTLFAVEWTS